MFISFQDLGIRLEALRPEWNDVSNHKYGAATVHTFASTRRHRLCAPEDIIEPQTTKPT